MQTSVQTRPHTNRARRGITALAVTATLGAGALAASIPAASASTLHATPAKAAAAEPITTDAWILIPVKAAIRGVVRYIKAGPVYAVKPGSPVRDGDSGWFGDGEVIVDP